MTVKRIFPNLPKSLLFVTKHYTLQMSDERTSFPFIITAIPMVGNLCMRNSHLHAQLVYLILLIYLSFYTHALLNVLVCVEFLYLYVQFSLSIYWSPWRKRVLLSYYMCRNHLQFFLFCEVFSVTKINDPGIFRMKERMFVRLKETAHGNACFYNCKRSINWTMSPKLWRLWLKPLR